MKFTINFRRFVFSGGCIALLAVGHAGAVPSISSLSGTVADRQSVQISGSGFGSKSPAAPLVWADFASGLQPSSLGQKTAWDQVQNMVWSNEGPNGANCAKAADGSGTWTLRVDYSNWTGNGQKSYIFKHQKMNFLITDQSQNWKIWRLWASNGQGPTYPNIYAASNNGRVYVETSAQETGYWGSFAVGTTNWVAEETIFQASSGVGAKDGLLVMRYDGSEVARGSVMTQPPEYPGYMTYNYVVHAVNANTNLWTPAWDNNNRVWVSDVYADTTWSRVMLGNASNFAACTQMEMQIPSAWSDSSLTVTFHSGSFANGAHVYLYVFDSNGNANTSGYPVTIGATQTNQAPVVSAGSNQTITLPASARLQGTVTDDGLPNPPGAVTSQWTQISGPGQASFTNAAASTTNAFFSQPGTYVLQLSGSDSVLSSAASVTITVNASVQANQAPIVSAGTDQTVTFPNTLTLQGTATDDGLPNPPGRITTNWVSLSGPAAVTFSNPAALNSVVTFTQPGSYVLQLSASDSVLSSQSSVHITVGLAQSGAPLVSVGSDQTVTLPQQAVLTAQVKDTQPDSIAWTKASGPGAVAFDTPNSATTSAHFSQAGVYVLRLTATNVQASASANVTVTAVTAGSVVQVVQTKNYFNPVRGENVQIGYNLGAAAHVAIQIYDRLGRIIKALSASDDPPGIHYVPWDGRNDDGSVVASGIYYASIKAGQTILPWLKLAVLK